MKTNVKEDEETWMNAKLNDQRIEIEWKRVLKWTGKPIVDQIIYIQDKQEGQNPLCQNPIYAECRTTRDSDGQPWYEISPSFVPDFNYPCDGNGIRCSVDGDAGHIQSTFQECPDLQVRYACPVTSKYTCTTTFNKILRQINLTSSSSFLCGIS